MKNRSFIKLYRNVLSKPEMTDLVAEEGAAGFGTYLIVLLYLSQCDDFEGAYTNGQLSTLAVLAKKSRAYVRHIIADYDLFVIEGKRFRDSFLNRYSPARNNRNAGEEIEIEEEKEIKEKAGSVCLDDTRPPESPPAAPRPIGPSAYETVDREGLRRGNHGEPVPWWAPPQTDIRQVWSLTADCWRPPAGIDRHAERQKRQTMAKRDFMMKTAYETLAEHEQTRIQDHAKRQ
jgi:hypothetical protein